MRGLVIVVLLLVAWPATAHARIIDVQPRDVDAVAGQQATGVLVATFSDDANRDPSRYRVTIDWGDGTQSAGTVTCVSRCGPNDQGPHGFEVRGTHTYQTATTTTIRVTISNPEQQEAVETQSTARVAAAPGPPAEQPPAEQPPQQQQPTVPTGPPVVDGVPIRAVAGRTATHAVARTTPPAGPVRVVIDWGDGARTSGAVAPDGTITGTHTFPRPGLHQVVTTVTTGGGTSLGSATAAVLSGSATPPACETKVAFGPLRAEGPCLKPVGEGGNFEVRDARVRINGVDVVAKAGARVRLNKTTGRLVLNGAVTVRVGPIVVYEGRTGATLGLSIGADLPTAFDVAVDAGFSGFPIKGSIGVRFKGDLGAEVPVHLGLPAAFGGITGDALFKLTMKDGLRFDGLKVKAGHVKLGGLEIKDLFVDYRRTGDVWKGGASLKLPSGLGLDATPPPDEEGVAIAGGRLKSLGATLSFPSPGLTVASGVFLNKIGFAVATAPTRFLGNASFSTGSVAGKTLARIDGSMFIAFARPEEPYVTKVGLPPTERRFTSTAFHAAGSVRFAEFADLAGAYVLYQHAGHVEVGGRLGASLLDGLVSAEAQLVGAANVLTGQFNAEAKAKVCAGGKLCVGGDILASSTGIGACARFTWPLPDVGGYRFWKGGGRFMWKACDLGAVRVAVTPSVRAAQAGGRAFALPSGVEGTVIGVEGGGEAPRVALVDPAGRRYVLGPDGTAREDDLVAFRSEADRTTYFAIARPRAGTWRAEPEPGGAAPARVRFAEVLPEPQVTARTSRATGGTRLLRFRARTIEGQRIVFFEQGRDVLQRLGATSARSGTIRFRPADGGRGPREVIARVESFGAPRTALTVARFPAPGPRRPAAPRGLRLAAGRGGRLCATWRPAADAVRYEIAFRLRDGARTVALQRGRRACVRPSTSRRGGTVRVTGLSIRGTRGPAARATRR